MKTSVRCVLRLLFTDSRTLRDCFRWGLNEHAGKIGQDHSTRKGLVVLPVDDQSRVANRTIREHKIDPATLAEASAEASTLMRGFLQKTPTD